VLCGTSHRIELAHEDFVIVSTTWYYWGFETELNIGWSHSDSQTFSTKKANQLERGLSGRYT
jgi:hypothetical protein